MKMSVCLLTLCMLLCTVSPGAAVLSPKDKSEPLQEDRLYGSLRQLVLEPTRPQAQTWLTLLDNELTRFPSSAGMVGDNINVICALHSTRSQRLDTALLADRTVYARMTEYLLDNIHRIDSAKGEPFPDFLHKIPPAMHASIRNAWREPGVRNTELGYIRTEALRKIGEKINSGIDKTAPDLLLDYSVFGIDAFTAATFHNYAGLGEQYTAEDFLRFQKTITWLLAAPTVRDTLFLCYLYVQCNIQYTFNRTHLSTTDLIRSGRGDCSEIAAFYSQILTLKGQNMPEVYISFEDASRIGHAFGAIFLGGDYYLYDQSKIIKHADFDRGLQLFFPQTTMTRNPVKIIVSRRDRRDPFNVYRRVYPSESPFVEMGKAGPLAPR